MSDKKKSLKKVTVLTKGKYEFNDAEKQQYHLKGIGGKPSKQMKELKMKPMPDIFFKNPPNFTNVPKPLDKKLTRMKFGKSIVKIMSDVNKKLDKEITLITDKKCKNPKSPKPFKNV